MANVTKRKKKDGSISYLIRVFLGEHTNGFQIVKSKTWVPPIGMGETKADKEADRQAILFEEKIKAGILASTEDPKFEVYAIRYVETAQIAESTRERYRGLLQRTNKAIGHFKLSQLRAHHLDAFYQNLAENGIKGVTLCTSSRLDKIMTDRSLSANRLAKAANTTHYTISRARSGERISLKKATDICVALQLDLKNVFTITESDERLSDRTILHYHRLISTILAKAKREGLILVNVAKERATAPKARNKQARYLSDTEMQHFYSLVIEESDIRVKTALILLMFTGMRRGELCGLSWADIDDRKETVSVKRSSQYQSRKGIVETPTKTESSVRSIKVPAIVIDVLKEYRIWWMKQKLMLAPIWKGDILRRLFMKMDGSPIMPDTINFWLDRFCKQYNLPHYSTKDFRHTFATLQITAGVDLKTLQSRTGHSQVSTLVNVYSHVIERAQAEASESLAQIIVSSKDKDDTG